MNKPAAFRATYSDLKLIKTRQCVQIVFELPLADFDAAYDVLGGMPNPANETWFGIAPIKLGSDKPEAKRDWRDLPPQQQAGIRCDEPTFVIFLNENHPDDWREIGDAADFVRSYCNIKSRAELATNHKARTLWHQLDTEYQAWKALEHA